MYRLCSGVFLLLVTASIGSAPGHLHVYLQPTNNISVCEGDSVQMNCTWNPPGNVKGKWIFNDTPEDRTSLPSRINNETSFSSTETDSWSTLTISSIRTNESGWYFCKVTRDKPDLKKNCSNRIYVLVEPNPIHQGQNSTSGPNQTSTQEPTNVHTCTSPPPTQIPPIPVFSEWWLWVAVAVGCVVLILSVVAVCKLSRRSKEIIYENTAPKKPNRWRRNRAPTDECNLSVSKKVETIKPLRKYDTLSQNRIRRP